MPVLSKIGSEFLVKQEGSQASVGYLPDGRYMVAWTKFDLRQFGVDPATVDPASVGARFYNANGTPMEPELAISPADTFSQIKPQVTVLSSGRYLLTWVDPTARPNNNLLLPRTEWVRAQVYDATGAASGPGFMLSTTPVGWDNGLEVVALSGDRFVAVWSANRDVLPLQPNHDIRARIFNIDGSPASPEWVVNTETAGSQFGHSVAVMEDGRFVVTWMQDELRGAWAQVYASDGTMVGSNILIVGGSIWPPAVVSLDGGGFLAYWQTQPPLGESSLPIRAQKIDANGNRVGSTFDLPQSFNLDQLTSIQLVTLDNGRVVIVSTEWGYTQKVWIKVLEADGSPAEVSRRFDAPVISDHYSVGGAPTVTAMPDGQFSLTWRGGTDGSELKMQVFSAAIQSWTLTGTAGNDRLEGDQLNDTLSGQAGDDEFSGLGGMDTLDGGAGLDTASYAEKTANVVVVLNGANSVNVTVGGVVEDTIRNIENLVGGSGNDFFYGDALTNVFTGGDGVDVLLGQGGNDQLFGGEGLDYLYGGEGGDWLWGESGNDVLFGEAGNDVLVGGYGNDYIDGGSGNDHADGGDGDDIVLMGAGNDTVLAGLGSNYADLGDGDDHADGTYNEFTIVPGIGGYYQFGVHVFFGGKGNDTLLGGERADYLDGGEGDNYLSGGYGNDILLAGIGAGTLWGLEDDEFSGNNIVLGGAGDDYIVTGYGDDHIEGGWGNDYMLSFGGTNVFYGGAGIDSASAGTGDDTFVVTTNSGFLAVYGFSAGGTEDKVQLSGIGFSNFAQVRSSLTFNSEYGATVLSVDTDTSVWLIGVNSNQLTAADFLFA